MLTSAFRAFGGEELVRDFLQDLPGGFWTQFIVVMAVIFLLGFFLDFIEIAVVVVPIIAPILLAETSANVTAVWLGVMIGVNLQTSFLTPPFGFALFYLRGVAPKHIATLDIWKGAVAFIILQLIGLGIVGFYPTLVNYLPNRVYLTSKVAPPPMNPRLQYCLQEYKFLNYENNENELKMAISGIQTANLDYLPEDKVEIFESHFEKTSSTFDLVKKVKSTDNEYNLFIKDYRDLHFKVRKKQKKILKIDKKIKRLEAEIRNLNKDEVSEKNNIQLKIEDLKLEKEDLNKNIPKAWKEKNNQFNKIHKAKNVATKKYRKNVDQAYDALIQIKTFIKDGELLENLSKNFEALNNKIINMELDNAQKDIDILFEKLSEISGTDELSNKLDDIIYEIDSDEVDNEKIVSLNYEAQSLFNDEVNWRNKASQSLADKLEKYDLSIKDTIGLRLQSRLTKKQAKFVSKCRSVHRDISLNF